MAKLPTEHAHDPNHPYPFRAVLDKLMPNQGAEMLRYGWRRPDILSLGQGEGDAPTPQFIIDAACKAMREGKTFYAPVLGHLELRQELSNYYGRIFDKQIPTNRIFVTGSGTTAMHLALTSILDEGDEVVSVTPIWKNLLGAVELTQSTGIQVPLRLTTDGWRLDLNELFAAVTPKTKAIMVVSPSNPTGWVMSTEEIQAVLNFARDRNIWIIADEVYNRITFEMDRAPSFLDHAYDDDLLYVVNSFSKNYAMTGWRLGWLVGPAQSETRIRDIALYDNLGPTSFIQFGAITALRHGEPYIKDQLKLWRGNRDMIMERLGSDERIHLHKPKSTFYAFMSIDGEPDCMDFAKRLIDEGALSLAPGCAFGQCCKGFIRLSFAVSQEKMSDALDRFQKVLG